MDSGFDMLGQFSGGHAFETQQIAPARVGPANMQGAGTNKLKLGVHLVNWTEKEIVNKDD